MLLDAWKQVETCALFCQFSNVASEGGLPGVWKEAGGLGAVDHVLEDPLVDFVITYI